MSIDISHDEEYVGLIDSDASPIAGQKTSFWGIFGLSCVPAYYFYSAGNPKIAVGIIGVVLGTAMLVAPQVCFYVYFGWQALDSVFLSSEEAILTPAKAMSLFIIIVYLLSIWRIRQRILVSKSVIIVMLLFSFFGLLIVPFAIDRFSALRYSLQITVHVILVAGAIHFLIDEKRVHSAFFWCFISGILAGSALLITGGISKEFSRGTLGEFANPNTTAYALSVSVIALVGLWGLRKARIHYALYLLGAFIIFLAMMKTGSRASLIALFLSMSFGALFAKGVKITKRVLIPILLSILVAGSVLYILNLKVLDEKSQYRLEELVSRNIDQHGSGSRVNILETAVSAYLENRPLTGWGFGNTHFAMQIYRGWDKDIHNSLIGPLCDSGPIGFSLFVTGLILLYLKVRGISDPRKNIAATTIYIFLILSSLTHTIHFSKWFWIPVTLCLLLAEQDKRDELQQSVDLDFQGQQQFEDDY